MICTDVGRIKPRLDKDNRHASELLRLAKLEARKIGITEFASRLHIDPANLSKMIEGKRALSASVHGRLCKIILPRSANPVDAKGEGVCLKEIPKL